jgi:hypothetical protein
MARTIIVGDLHGCLRELEDLLAYVGFGRGDQLVSVGDLVVRGPKPRGVLKLMRALGCKAVRGNHEDRLLRWKRSVGTGHELVIGNVTRKTAESLRPRDWEYIESLPLFLKLAEHNALIVHAGLMPSLPVENQNPRVLLYVRTLGPRGEPVETRGRSWAHSYHGEEHVVFGHNAQPEPEIAENATGIDTGVVYGGRLTAMVLREGERPPPPRSRHSVLVSVPAHRVYYRPDRSRPKE